MKKRLLSILVILSLVATVFAGCGGSVASTEVSKESVASTEESTASEETASATGEFDKNQTAEISLYTYYADAGIPTIDRVIEELKKIYPNVTINIEHRTDSDGQVLKTRASVGELPDIFETTGQLADIFTESGHIKPMDSAIEAENYFDLFVDGAFEGKQSADGKFYALSPNTMQSAQIFYNIKIFEDAGLSPPTNFEEFKNVVSTLSAKSIIPLALFGQQKWPGLQLMDMAVIAQGQIDGLGSLEDGKTSITEPEFLAAAQKMEELVKLNLIGKGALNTNASQASEQLQTGQGGMFINGAWYFNDSKEFGDQIGSFEFNPFADADKAEEYKWNLSGGASEPGGYAVNPESENVDLATKILLDFVRIRNIVEVENFGSQKVVKEDVQPKDSRSAAFQRYIDSAGNVKSRTKYEWGLNNQELIVALEDSTEMLLTGNLTAEEYITSLGTQLAAIYG